MVGLGLRQLRCVFDPWNLVAGIPVGLTMSVIAYAGLAWTESLGEAKPVTPTVKQAALATALVPTAPLAPSHSDRHPAERDDLSALEWLPDPPPFPQASETPHAAELKAQLKRLALSSPVELVGPVPFSAAVIGEPPPVATEAAPEMGAEPARVMSPAVGLGRDVPETNSREPTSETKPGSTTQETSTIHNLHEERGPSAFHRGALGPGMSADEQGRGGGRVTLQSPPQSKKRAAAPPSSGASSTGEIDIVVHSANQRRDEGGDDVKQVAVDPSGNSRDTARKRNLLKADPLPYTQGTARRRTTGAAAPSTVATASAGEPTILERIFQFRVGTSLQSDSPPGDGGRQSERR